MNLLLDTHVILWAAFQPSKLSARAARMLMAPDNTLWFSVASIWEVTIKRALDRADFQVDASVLRAGLLSNGYQELAIEGRHCLTVATLPLLHRDPFDRMLVAQAASDGYTLVTADQAVAAYDGPIELI